MGLFDKLGELIRDEDDDDFDPDEYDEYEEQLAKKEEKKRLQAEKKAAKAEKQRQLREQRAAREEEEDEPEEKVGFFSKLKGYFTSDDDKDGFDDDEYKAYESQFDDEPRSESVSRSSSYQRSGKRSVIPSNSHRPNINRSTTYSQQAQTGATASFNNRQSETPVAPARPRPTTGKDISFNRQPAQASNMAVSIIKPTSFEECQDICDTLLAGKPIIVNLEGFNDMLLGQRIMDFVSGCVYSINGKLHQISGYIFIISPDGVDVSGDYLAMMKENDFGVPTFVKNN